MEIEELIKKNIGKTITEDTIENFLEGNNIDFEKNSNIYEIYDEDKMIIVNFEEVETKKGKKNIIVRNYEKKDCPREMPLSDINNQH